jgi:hypothetical protein
MTGQRTWMRVEAPGTFRGHALEATIGGNHFVAWENSDGGWSLSINGSDPLPKAGWAEVRHVAERDRSQAVAYQQNPMDPIIASAAASGMAFAMRQFLIANPAPNPGNPPAVHDVLRAVPASVLVRPPRQDKYGNVWLLVRRGHRGRVRRAVRSAHFPFLVQIMEAA